MKIILIIFVVSNKIIVYIKKEDLIATKKT